MQSFEWSWVGLWLLMSWPSHLCLAESGQGQRSGTREVQALQVAELLLPAHARGEVSLASEREARGADTHWPWSGVLDGEESVDREEIKGSTE